MLDIGPGALQRLAQAGESYKELQHILVSHAHPDHTSSLIPLLQALKYTPGYTHTNSLTLYGPETVWKYLEVCLNFAPELRPEFPFEFVILDDGSEICKHNWHLGIRAMRHNCHALGFRFTVGGCTIVYGADSGPCRAIVDLAQGADLLILEASFPKSEPSELHLTTAEAGEIARAARVSQLLLTHLYPHVSQMGVLQREAEVREGGFSGKVIFAEDLMELHIRGTKR